MKDMLGRASAMEPESALRLILDSIGHLKHRREPVELSKALGRVLADPVTSPEDIPGFARSTMDGYALKASDTFGATETNPAYLELSGEILMGQVPEMKAQPGRAIKISTGGMLPEGADAVLMFEYATNVDNTMIEAMMALAPGENVIQRGEDIQTGETMLKERSPLRPQDIAALASVGITEISATPRPRAAIISTGDEIIPPSQPLRPGLIRDSNSYYLSGAITLAGAVAVNIGIMPDRYEDIMSAVKSAAKENDMVLISGGSSVGTRDLTERVIAELGQVLFHSVQLKPGKPFMAGVIDDKPVFGLPGHPRAVAVCFDTFVRPALDVLSGIEPSSIRKLRTTLTARLSRSIHSTAGRREHVDVILEKKDGEFQAEPVQGKSGLLRTMTRADGSICMEIGCLGHDKGELVTVTLY